jgi:hypothetical protein
MSSCIASAASLFPPDGYRQIISGAPFRPTLAGRLNVTPKLFFPNALEEPTNADGGRDLLFQEEAPPA